MKTSVIIPSLNENPSDLHRTVENLINGCDESELELIIVNDGSINSDGSARLIRKEDIPYRNVVIINNDKRHGIGYSFDKGVEIARGDIIVLMGADVLPEHGWFTKILSTTVDGEVCTGASVGLQPGNYDINTEGLYKRYGAKILFTLTTEDLPKSSPLRKIPDYRDILEAKWLPKQSDEPYEIPCVYGAFYWMQKSFYERIHGFDLQHKYWGCFEPWLSLKARVYGGKCVIYPDFKVGHVFGRINDGDRANRMDYKFWNKLWVAHTMLEDSFRDEVINFPNPSLNFSEAQVMIRHNWDIVQETHQRNIREGKLIEKP